MGYDVFISHASEDKAAFVKPLAEDLARLGVHVWYDEFALKLGDSLSRSIDKGLALSKFGIVVLSKAFLSKPWPEYELRGLVTREIGKDKVILPVWHNVTRDDIMAFSPPLADKLALNTAIQSLSKITVDIVEVVRPDIHEALIRLKIWKQIVANADLKFTNLGEIHPGPIRHEKLPDALIGRLKLVYEILGEVMDKPFDELIEAFQRDLNPANEVAIWEKLATAYLRVVKCHPYEKLERGEILGVLIRNSMGVFNPDDLKNFKHLDLDTITLIAEAYRSVSANV